MASEQAFGGRGRNIEWSELVSVSATLASGDELSSSSLGGDGEHLD